MANLCIIPARGGSKRIPRKNIRDFLGKPIIGYSIEAAINSGLFDEVMVSTDSSEIAEVAEKLGAKVPFLRSAENANDFASTAAVLTEVLNQYQLQGRRFDYACCVYATAPLITLKNIKEAYEVMRHEAFDCVFPVVAFSYPVQRALLVLSNGKMVAREPENIPKRSQDLEKVYHDAGQFYWFNCQAFLEKKQLWTDNTGIIVISEMEAQDIDSEEDWKLSEMKYAIRRK